MSFGKGRKHGIATIFRLLIACVLLSGGLVFQSPSRCLVSAQDDKNNDKNDKNNDKDDKNNNKNDKNNDKNDKNNDKNKDKDKNKDPTDFPSQVPSEQPSVRATPSPTREPTLGPTKTATLTPTTNPTSSPTRFTFKAALPEINIDITTVVDDVFSFAALLLDEDTVELGSANDVNNRNGLNAYFEDFVEDLLIASEAVTPSSLDSVDIEVRFLPLENEDQESAEMTAETKSASPNGTPVRISIKGEMNYLVGEGETGDETDILLLEERICHTLAVYFTFWSTDEMRASLSEFGLTDPHITAVRVDDKLILVAADSNPLFGDADGDDDSGADGDNDNLLVVPTDSGDVIEMNDLVPTIATAAVGSFRRAGALVSFAATAGSTILLLVTTILA